VISTKKNVVDVGLEGRVLVCAVVEESAENRCGWSYVGQRRLYQVLSCIGMERAVLMKSWRLGRADTAPTRRKQLSKIVFLHYFFFKIKNVQPTNPRSKNRVSREELPAILNPLPTNCFVVFELKKKNSNERK
jgi:hypothetical protein